MGHHQIFHFTAWSMNSTTIAPWILIIQYRKAIWEWFLNHSCKAIKYNYQKIKLINFFRKWKKKELLGGIPVILRVLKIQMKTLLNPQKFWKIKNFPKSQISRNPRKNHPKSFCKWSFLTIQRNLIKTFRKKHNLRLRTHLKFLFKLKILFLNKRSKNYKWSLRMSLEALKSIMLSNKTLLNFSKKNFNRRRNRKFLIKNNKNWKIPKRINKIR